MTSILANVRPDRQTALFSATFPRRIASLASSALRDPMRITVGQAGQAASEVHQRIIVLPHAGKWEYLITNLPDFLSRGKVLIFVSQRAAADELCGSLNRSPQARDAVQQAWAILHSASTGNEAPSASSSSFSASSTSVAPSAVPPLPPTASVALSLHGEKHQSERDDVIRSYKSGPWGRSTATSSSDVGKTAVPYGPPILVATDVASRGLDISGVGVVVNFDAAKNIDTHVHRVGRTGRTGADGFAQPGLAVTFVQPSEGAFACELIRNLRLSGKVVPPQLSDVARAHPKFGWAMAPVQGVGGSSGDVSGAGSNSSSGSSGGYTRRDGTFVPPPSSSSSTAYSGGGKKGGKVSGNSTLLAPGLGFGSGVAAGGDDDADDVSVSSNYTFGTGAGTNSISSSSGGSANYRPPLPSALDASISNSSSAQQAPIPAMSALDRQVATIRAAAAAAVAASAGGDGNGSITIGHVSEYMTSEAALAMQDGNALDDVEVGLDDEEEATNLRRQRRGRFNEYGRFNSATSPSSSADNDDDDSAAAAGYSGGGRTSALAEMRSATHSRLAHSFASSFVAAGGRGSGSGSGVGSGNSYYNSNIAAANDSSQPMPPPLPPLPPAVTPAAAGSGFIVPPSLPPPLLSAVTSTSRPVGSNGNAGAMLGSGSSSSSAPASTTAAASDGAAGAFVPSFNSSAANAGGEAPRKRSRWGLEPSTATAAPVAAGPVAPSPSTAPQQAAPGPKPPRIFY